MVEVAENGKEAVEMCLKKDYAAVVMDVQMPEKDGIEATSQIRKKISIVFVKKINEDENTAHRTHERHRIKGTHNWPVS